MKPQVFKIKIKEDIYDVIKFTHIAEKINCSIDILGGRYIVNGKSMMGILSLDLSKPLTLNIYSKDKYIKNYFRDFIIKDL